MKKYLKWIIGFIVVCGLFSACTTEETDTTNTADTSTSNTSNTTEETTNASEENVSEEVVKEENKSKIEAGMYKVGTDIPAGEYLVQSTGMAYFEATKDSSGEFTSIIFNDNLTSDAHAYVTLNDGEYFKLERGEMYPVASAPSVVPEDGLYTDGMYKVGTDIPAGEYKVILTSITGMGYLEVSTNSRHTFDTIVANENVTADTYITVKDGQYLTLSGLNIQK